MTSQWKNILAAGVGARVLGGSVAAVTPVAAANGCYAHTGCSRGGYYAHPYYGYYGHPYYGHRYYGPGPVVGSILGGAAAALVGGPYYGPGPYYGYGPYPY